MLQRLRTETKKRGVFLKVNTEEGFEIQKGTLKKLLSKAKETSFGETYRFEEILKSDQFSADFAEAIQAGDYLKMLPWWTRCRMGESNVTWPGSVSHYAVSSGTSDGSSKYIPVTKQMLRSIRRASLRQVLAISATDVPKDHLAKKWLMIGGSTALEYNGMYYSGDLSGITTGQVPIPFQRISKPEPRIRKEKDWEQKIEQITEEAQKWDVGMVAGVPAWVKLLFENILDKYKIENIHELWPHFEVYIHGGVSLNPYKKSLDALMGRPIKYFETYLASEGFIAFQSRQDSNGGMRLLLRNGIYYEFVPFNSDNFDDNGEMKPSAKAITLAEVNDKEEYALLISTCAGAWRYLIGDTIRFTDLTRCEIQITGRTKHFLSLCGEHLSVDNMNKAIEIVADEYNVNFEEYTVGGVPFEGFFAHEWYIGVDREDILDKANEIKEKLDMTLKVLNDDYRTERSAALKDVIVHLVPSSYFIDWLKEKGKVGSQNKFPRVLKNESLKSWKEFIESRA
ncbi:GH3 auxin-responsive promoter family protein [bacterium]|nr:GH3 auxin-responsive promoter family protein [bacterium]